MTFNDNYFIAGTLIQQRLREQVPGLAFVDGSRSIKEIIDRTCATPAAVVVYDGDIIKDAPGQSADLGRVQVVQQRWHIELLVHNHSSFVSGEGEREEAGQLLSQIINALSGWAPSNEHKAMRRIQAPLPTHTNDGYGYYPIKFITEIVTQ